MGSKGTNTTTSSFEIPPVFKRAYKESLNMARDAVNNPYKQYKGKLVAGLSPTQKQGIANVNAAQGMALPFIQQGSQYTQQAARGITPELYQRFYSPYVQDVANATQANLLESNAQQLSGLKGGAIQAGAFGGDRGGVASAELARQQNLAMGQTMADVYNQGYGQAMGLAGQQVANLGAMGQQMAGLGLSAQGSVLQGAQAQMAAGAQQQATEQARLQAAYEQWMQKQAYPYQKAQFFANIAQGLGAGAGGTSTTTAPAPSMFSQILGGVGAIGSIYSDERIKENIEPVGKLNDGQTIYRYNFKGDPKTQIGLLAQEVEHRNPDAVTEAKGLKMVNYKGATEDAARMSSAGGVVAPGMERMNFADGGVPFYPYGNAPSYYIPEGKIGGNSDNIPKRPDPYEDKGLAEDWQNIMPLNSDQIAGLSKLSTDLGFPTKEEIKEIFAPKSKDSGYISSSSPGYEVDFTFARGGVAGHYADGGTAARRLMADGGEGPMYQAIDEASGLGGVDYSPLLQAESGGNFAAENERGYVGRGQFGEARLSDAKRAGIIPPDMTPEQFRNNPDAQKATEKWHFGDINEFIDQSGLGSVEGKTIDGIPITRAGLVNVAHLGGKHGLQKFISTGGRYNPADANGTTLSDYLAMGAKSDGGLGQSVVVPTSSDVTGVVAPTVEEKPRSKFDVGKLFASEDNPSLIERIMGRRLSPEARAAIMNASFALMAGRSPFFFTNLGEAGKIGTQTYYNALANKRELQKMQIEKAKTSAETDKVRADIMGHWIERWRAFNFTNAASGKPSIDFNQYLKMVGVDPRMFSTSATQIFGGDQGDNTSVPTIPVPGGPDEGVNTSPTQNVAEPSATPEQATEAPQPIPQPDSTETVQPAPVPAEQSTKAKEPRLGTLDYYQQKLDRANKQLAIAGDNENLLNPALAAQKFAQDQIDKIQSSPEYKDQQAIVTNYGENRANLERLAQIYKNYKGGFGAEAIRDLTALANRLGIDLPSNITSDAAAFDEAYKLTVERSINDAGSNGLLKAPAAALLQEGKTQPTPEMMPQARYNLITKAIANLDRYKELYENWDTGPNFNKYANDWLKAHPLGDYIIKVKKEIPSFAGMEAQPYPQDVQDILNKKFPNASEGMKIGPANKPEAVFQNGQWMKVK